MSVFHNNALIGASGQGGGYTIDRSVRLRSSASAYLNRTPASSGNRQVMTFSFWMKRGLLTYSANYITLFSAYPGTSAIDQIAFSPSSDSLRVWFNGSASADLITTQVFRDPSSWYHVVVAIDTTQATSSNRIKVYVNGSQVTSFSTATYPTQNYNTYWNSSSYASAIGANLNGPQGYFDGYLTEINFIDGQALTPSSFGEYNADTGVWQAKKYAGTYGTNGFYLNFSDNTSTTTLGYDTSGNGNNWTANNISLTSGVTYDSMTDVPTLTGEGAANYCVINPLDGGSASATTVSDGNLKSTAPALWGSNSCTIGVSSGKWYWEQNIVSGSYWYAGIIIGQSNWSGQGFGQMSNGYSYYSTGQKQSNNVLASYGASFTSGDVIGVALDMDAGTITFYKNNTSQGTAYTGLTGVAAPAVSGYNGSVSAMNFGQRPFAYTPPTGFKSLNTYNLPDSTIVDGSQHFGIKTRAGTGASVSISDYKFAPDFVWIKARTNAYYHKLLDKNRGANKVLSSNATDAESTETQGLMSFDTNGYTLGTSSDSTVNNAGSGQTYVDWAWKAGGTAVSNTDGSITSNVSANPSAGFSIVTYTGTGATSSGVTIGHGLGVTPAFIITKKRSGGTDYGWSCWHKDLGGNYGIWLNSTSARNSGMWTGYSNFSSTVFTPPNLLYGNENGATYVNYLFSEVAGFSKFGSYTGNGSSDGPFVFCGFRPRWVMVKRTDAGSAESWFIIDTARSSYNVSANWLAANLSNAEGTDVMADILSNGFKPRSTAMNASGGTYIFAAFAETDFAHALAR